MTRGRRLRLAAGARRNDACDGSAIGDADRGAVEVVACVHEGDKASNESRLKRRSPIDGLNWEVAEGCHVHERSAIVGAVGE